MSDAETAHQNSSRQRPALHEPMDPALTTIQPGGGVIWRWELAWGRLRRWWLKTFRRRYVERMQATRQGDYNPCPFDVLDSRDLKYYRNQGGYHWKPEDDPFTWRDRIPFARVGLAELLVFSVATFGTAGICFAVATSFDFSSGVKTLLWLTALTAAVIGGLIVWFFRDPYRPIPQDAGVIVSPADGKIVAIETIEHDEFIGGPAIMIGIFLSIFNVHINRSPFAARVIGLTYKPGKYLNALLPRSAVENEQLAFRLEEIAYPHRRMIVRQIAGAIARRIVCWLKPGDRLERGEQVGMIKLGSRTELVIEHQQGLEILTKIGDKVQAGSTVLARFANDE
ncbi:MAG: phosphatidylserine decarboxylase family protein [Planctomycetota bacterium]|nr:phosphatidylserine decarboxylase family protein [Planctomycetota bacterium]MDA1212831.1 phosphatidylserine decarboxylase family protein [Planctomycetota bacterium]